MTGKILLPGKYGTLPTCLELMPRKVMVCYPYVNKLRIFDFEIEPDLRIQQSQDFFQRGEGQRAFGFVGVGRRRVRAPIVRAKLLHR